jgi:hypothetical protein
MQISSPQDLKDLVAEAIATSPYPLTYTAVISHLPRPYVREQIENVLRELLSENRVRLKILSPASNAVGFESTICKKETEELEILVKDRTESLWNLLSPSLSIYQQERLANHLAVIVNILREEDVDVVG